MNHRRNILLVFGPPIHYSRIFGNSIVQRVVALHRHINAWFSCYIATGQRPTRLQSTVWLLLSSLAAALTLRDFQAYEFGAQFDDARYVILARSLLQSRTYGMIHLAGTPGISHFPFGYPMLLAPLVNAFPDNFDLLKLTSLGVTLLNGCVLFWGWRWLTRRLSYWLGLAVTGLYLLSPLTIDLSRRVMSEPVFTLLCLLSILLAERAARGQNQWWWSPVMSLLLFSVVSVRTVGFILLASVFVYLLWVQRLKLWKELAATLAGMMLLLALVTALTPVKLADIVPNQYLSYVTSGGQTELQDRFLNYQLYRIRQHLGKDLRSVILPLGGGTREQALADQLGMTDLPVYLGLLCAVFIAIGYVCWFSVVGPSLFQLFSVMYFGVVWFWTWEDPRLLYPIDPQLQLGFILGLGFLPLAFNVFVSRNRLLPLVSSRLVAGLVLILLLMSVYGSARIDNSRLHIGDMQERSTWIKANTLPSAVIMSEATEIDSLYSARRAVEFPNSYTTSADLESYLVNNKVDYLLIAPMVTWETHYVPSYSPSTDALLPLVELLVAKGRLELAFSSEPDLIKVYKTKNSF